MIGKLQTIMLNNYVKLSYSGITQELEGMPFMMIIMVRWPNISGIITTHDWSRLDKNPPHEAEHEGRLVLMDVYLPLNILPR